MVECRIDARENRAQDESDRYASKGGGAVGGLASCFAHSVVIHSFASSDSLLHRAREFESSRQYR